MPAEALPKALSKKLTCCAFGAPSATVQATRRPLAGAV
jgi:hypothetical protein